MMYLLGGNMWPFKKKTPKIPELPPLPITNIEQKAEEIPEELPPLELKSEKIQPAEEETSMYESPEPLEKTIQQKPEFSKQGIRFASGEKFMSSDAFQNIASNINSMTMDFNEIDIEIGKILGIDNAKGEKMESLQGTLEETGKKLMFIDNSLFGG